jgi:hypothetical protein
MTKYKVALSILLLGVGATCALAQQETKPAPKPRRKAGTQEMLEQMDLRIEKLEQLVLQMQQQMVARDKQVADTKKEAIIAQTEVQEAAKQQKLRSENTLQTVAKTDADLAALSTSLVDLKKENANLAETVVVSQKHIDTLDRPGTIHFMGVDLKPGGFLAGETVTRQHAVGGDVSTPFASIPFSGQTPADFSEFNGSGRQSRFTLLVEGKLSNATLRGYYEADFLSAGTTSNSNQSNSYTLRQRQLWAQAELKSGWTFTGGQMWSLATAYTSGLTNLREAIPQTIDSQYNVGFTWERQFGFRVVKTVGDKVWVGVSVEQPQTLNIGGHNLPAIVYQQPGNTAGSFNPAYNYSYNFAPDLIAKVAYEPGYGHYELFAIGRFFRARVFPNAVSLDGSTVSTTPTAGAYTSKAQGGGIGANARVPFLNKRLEVGAHILAGDGIGRYSSSTLADATEHADGSLELLSGGSALGSLDFHATHRLDLYGYYGGEYAKRAFYATGLTVLSGPTLGQPILAGYGAPTNDVSGCHIETAPVITNGGYVAGGSSLCTADVRNVQEGTLGFVYNFYNGSKGKLQQGFQYSYVVRHSWQGVGDPLSPLGGSPKAINNMWLTSFRYYLPQ